eukprot:TRINITY_DN10536_c0_g1_i1.p1 TRINITY_DN10536_c0_g1~~TRINITY_DN10536_c0_g1_i1.p1  ORF type:complete len:581 (-),score=120.45 TRINITY_DN10536_c0_g1_i1:45-1661(-)
MYIPRYKVDVRFKFTRTPIRRMHQSLELIGNNRRLLFPDESDIEEDIDFGTIRRWKNSKLNDEQKTAVKNIVFGRPGAPYIIYGPPGTGKTITVVESIKQLVSEIPTCKILVCAPSNSAADLICERLSIGVQRLNIRQMFRLNAYKRSFVCETASKWLPYSHFDELESAFKIPDEIGNFQVVISTCISAAMLYSLGNDLKFSHVFIDECGFSVEPETITSFAGLINRKSKVILAGDPNQLGPIVRSGICKKNNFHISMLERIMNIPCYTNNSGNYDNRVITKLVNNYRSHEKLLELPSQLFYDNELKPCGDAAITNIFTRRNNFFDLPNQDIPLIFHGLSTSQDDREEGSPSFFNIQEASTIFEYIYAIRTDSKLRETIKEKDIGVITPYHRQVVKIRKLLRDNNMEGIKVGSVEEFQGQEKMVILVSTVRSSKGWSDFDIQHNLGFLKNPKRFNVAITRAQSLLIVVGNPKVLYSDKHWKALIDFSLENNCYVGDDPDGELIFDDIIENGLYEEEYDEEELESSVSKYEDPEWRNDY